MKKAVIALILFILTATAYSQSFNDYWWRRDWGFGVTWHTFDGYYLSDTTLFASPVDTSEVRPKSFGMTVFTGWNFPVIELADHLTAGINPNIAITLGLSEGPGIWVEAPIFVTLKYGTDATWDSGDQYEKKFGAAIGIGYHGLIGYTEAPVDHTGIGFVYALPTAMAEINLVLSEKVLFKLRSQANIIRTKHIDYTNHLGVGSEISFGQWGVSLIRTIYFD